MNTIFLHPETISIFESLVDTNSRDPKQIFSWLYQNVFGNVAKKELDLAEILINNFDEGRKLGELIDLINQNRISQANAKDLLYSIIDGKFDQAMSLKEIISQELGDINQEIDFDMLVE